MSSTPTEALAIIERYDGAVNYLYPIIQSVPRMHGQFRDRWLTALLAVPAQIYSAAKSGQISRLYAVDGTLAELRWHLRFAVHGNRRLMTPHQHEVASVHLAEVGKMLGAWIKSKR